MPNQHDVIPRYDQMKMVIGGQQNHFVTLIAPQGNASNALWLHQNAWLSIANVDEGAALNYTCNNSSNGLYIFCIDGNFSIDDAITLDKRDAACIWNTERIDVKSTKAGRLLLIEIPLQP
jgi:hypothetical protein